MTVFALVREIVARRGNAGGRAVVARGYARRSIGCRAASGQIYLPSAAQLGLDQMSESQLQATGRRPVAQPGKHLWSLCRGLAAECCPSCSSESRRRRPVTLRWSKRRGTGHGGAGVGACSHSLPILCQRYMNTTTYPSCCLLTRPFSLLQPQQLLRPAHALSLGIPHSAPAPPPLPLHPLQPRVCSVAPAKPCRNHGAPLRSPEFCKLPDRNAHCLSCVDNLSFLATRDPGVVARVETAASRTQNTSLFRPRYAS